MSEENQSGLSAAEEAYFETQGEAGLPADPGGAEQPQEQATQEPAREPVRDDGGRFAKQTTVPHAVFHAEREEHKQTPAELAALKEFKAKVNERAAWIAEQNKPQEEPEPDPDKDIFGYVKWQKEQRARDRAEIEALRQTVDQRQQQEQQAQVEQRIEAAIWNVWEDDARGFAAQQPDFGPAAKWLAEARDKQLEAYASVDPHFANKANRDAEMNRELRDIIINARRNNISPAEAVYNIAKSWGYGGGQQQPIQLPEKLRGVQAAQEAARGVGQAAGRPAGGELTMEAILAMDRPEFDAWYADPKNARYYDRLMGA